jgi:hypothetical protein
MTHEEAVTALASTRYLLDELSRDEREAFEAHFFSCDACAEEMRSAAAMLQGAQTELAQSPGSAHVLPMRPKTTAEARRRWYHSTTLPWAAAAALACITTYQTFRVVPSVARDAAPVALVPVLLHPESRGRETVVTVRQGAPVTLALEVNDPPQGGQITYELRSLAGRHIASGQAGAPPPGMPLLLLLPAWTDAGDMHYILTVHDAAPAARPLGEYRFAVSAP